MASTGEPFGLFWNSENGDRTYDASSFEYWLKKFFTSGVFNGDLQVLATSGMTLKVGPGYANVDGKVRFWNAEFNLTLSPANSTYPRIDTVVITRDNVNRNITCEVVTGQYSGDTPQPTAPVRTAEIYQLVLAQIYVGNGVTEITQANITDTRPDPNLCGYITGTVTEMDFSQFTVQFESYFAQFKSQHEHEWSVWEQTQTAAYAAWFANVQAQQIADKADWDQWYADLQEELHMLPPDSAEYLQIQIDEIRENGTTGSIFHITTTNTELEGKTVTVSSGSEVRTATFDANLECTVVGFKSVGNVTFTSTDGIQTATRTLNINYYSKYEVPIAFWSATVNIQGDDNLKGATITVKDSNDTTVATVVLNVITGQGVFTAQKADTYTFNYTVSGTSYSESLAVTEETTYSLSLSAGFDWKGWVDTARDLDSSDYDSLEEVLANELAVRELCLEHACVDYLAAVPSVNTDIETIISNDLFAKWANNSDYSLDILGANTVIKALMDTADKYGYGEWVLMPQVPVMTSNTAPYGEASASSVYTSDYAAWKAFDGNDSSFWHSAPSTSSPAEEWIEYDFTSPVHIGQAYVKNDANRPYNTVDILGYDGTQWVSIGTSTDTSTRPNTRIVDCNSNVAYSKIRAKFSGLQIYNGSYAMALTSLQFYAWAPKGNVPVMTSNTAPYGVVNSSSNYTGYNAYFAFDGTNTSGSDCWHSGQEANPWIQYSFVNPVTVKKLYLRDRYAGVMPSIVGVLQGSNDGTNFSPALCSFSYTPTDNAEHYYDVDNESPYLIYRITFTTPTNNRYVSMGQIQFYGRELSVSVPTMTGNTTPYGEASASSNNSSSTGAYGAFDNSTSKFWSSEPSLPAWVGYKFPSKARILMFSIKPYYASSHPYAKDFKVQGSNDNFVNDIHDLYSGTFSNSDVTFYGMTTEQGDYTYHRVLVTTSNVANVVIEEIQFYGKDYSEKEFEEGTTKKWLYDHGVELETFELGNTQGTLVKEVSQMVITATSNNFAFCVTRNVNLSPFNLLRCKIGDIANYGNLAALFYGNTIGSAIAYTSMLSTMLPNNVGLDSSSASGTFSYVGVNTDKTTGHRLSVKELWLE